MKIRIASDLHFEHHRDHGATIAAELKDGDFNVLVLAGDIGNSNTIKDALVLLCESVAPKPVVYVMGNHEFYAGNREKAMVEILSVTIRCPNFHPLEDSSIVIDGQKFLGCTLWFPWKPSERTRGDDAQWSDFLAISGLRDWLTEKSKVSAKFLRSNVRDGDVVVTHYLPHPASIHPRYRGDACNKYFLHDLSSLVEKGGAKLWIHGHTHASVDKVVGKTRIVCNPFGYIHEPYQNEPNPEYYSEFDVEI